MTTQHLVGEIMNGAHVEVVLAKHVGLSVTRKDVQIVKSALKNRDEKQINYAITSIMQKHSKRKVI